MFLDFQAQTSDEPMGIEVERAEGIYMYSPAGKRYTDLVAGVSVSSVGHCHPAVVKAVCEQVARHAHLMVYGEFVQSQPALYASEIVSLLPPGLSNVYFVNSGAEASEGAMKLAKRYTGRVGVVACRNAYHGSTQGALSLIGDEYFRNAYRPLIPGTRFIRFNNFDDLATIDENIACVFIEPMQGEAGAIPPAVGYLQAVRERCDEKGVLLVFDEVQTGFGRLGTMFALEKYGVTPDILTLAKSLGGGMPLGAFVASKEIMNSLTNNPVLGHITTFGGHPVSCAAGLAALKVTVGEKLLSTVERKALLFRTLLQKAAIDGISGDGLLMAVELGSYARLRRFIRLAYEQGIATDWFLFRDTAFRISPPLIIDEQQIEETCDTLLNIINTI
jgi:acetylornithine/succinyldiaminopimelate/putrescine aminotransferase